jgi:hypothetical protein
LEYIAQILVIRRPQQLLGAGELKIAHANQEEGWWLQKGQLGWAQPQCDSGLVSQTQNPAISSDFLCDESEPLLDPHTRNCK